MERFSRVDDRKKNEREVVAVSPSHHKNSAHKLFLSSWRSEEERQWWKEERAEELLFLHFIPRTRPDPVSVAQEKRRKSYQWISTVDALLRFLLWWVDGYQVAARDKNGAAERIDRARMLIWSYYWLASTANRIRFLCFLVNCVPSIIIRMTMDVQAQRSGIVFSLDRLLASSPSWLEFLLTLLSFLYIFLIPLLIACVSVQIYLFSL